MEEAEADQEHLEMVKMQHGMEAEAEEAALDIQHEVQQDMETAALDTRA